MNKQKLYLKVCTLPLEEELEIGSEQFDLFKQTYQDAKQYVSDKDIVREYAENAGKNPVFSRIYSVTMAFVNKGSIRVSVLKGQEKDVLTELFNRLNDYFKSYDVVAWNWNFLSDFMKWRPIANNIPVSLIPMQIKDAQEVNWKRKLSKDLFVEANPGWHKISSTNAFATAGLNCKDIIDGADIHSTYRSGKVDEIDQSEILYVTNMVNLDRIFLGEDIIEDIASSIQEVEEVEEDKKTFLEKLYESKNLTEKLEKELKEILDKKKLTAKDKKNLRTVLRGVMLRTDFVNEDQDTKAVKEDKEEQIDNFINSL